MKYLIQLITLAGISIFFGSCQKNVTEDIKANANSITGTWELREAQVGRIPTITYPAGNGDIWKFTDSQYEQYANGNLIKSGHYTIMQDTSVVAEVGLVIPTGKFMNRIVLDSDSASRKTFIEVSDNSLTFLSGFFPLDGGSYLVYESIDDNR